MKTWQERGSIGTSDAVRTSASDTISSSTWLILAETLETLDTMDGMQDKNEDAIDVIKRGVGLLEDEEIDQVIRVGDGSSGSESGNCFHYSSQTSKTG